MNIPRPMLDQAIRATSKMPRHAKKEKAQNLRRGNKWHNAMLAGEAALDALEKANANR